MYSLVHDTVLGMRADRGSSTHDVSCCFGNCFRSVAKVPRDSQEAPANLELPVDRDEADHEAALAHVTDQRDSRSGSQEFPISVAPGFSESVSHSLDFPAQPHSWDSAKTRLPPPGMAQNSSEILDAGGKRSKPLLTLQVSTSSV